MNGSDGINGWDYLNSGEDSDSNYYGADGSWGYREADGSGSYHGADGSWGYWNSDGSSSYHGADGSYGYRNADGSGSFYDEDDGDGISPDSDGGGSLGEAILSLGLIAALAAVGNVKGRNARKQNEAPQRIRVQEEKARIRGEKRRAWRRCHWKGLVLSHLILAAAIAVSVIGYEYSRMIEFGTPSEELIGLDYRQALRKLEAAGFTSIRVREMKDLSLENLSKRDLVTDVEVAWYDTFNASSRYPSNAPITITYHSSKIIYAPVSSKKAKGKSYTDIVAQFEEAGFQQIETEIQYDIVTGWIKSDGDVSGISINGEDEFKTNAAYEVDARVVVTYHTWRKNKPG